MPEDPSPNTQQAHDGDKYGDLEALALDQAQQSSSLADRAKSVEMLKNLADARNSHQLLEAQRKQISATVVATWAPMLTVVATVIVAAVTLVYQGKLQREGSEDTQWREALKSVSFADQASSTAGIFAMQGFFSSPRYSAQARTIASVLLTNVANVNAFDEVMSRMGVHTDASNFEDLTSIAQTLGFAERARFHIDGAASSEKAPFLTADVTAIEVNLKDLEHDSEQQKRVSSWEIDSASQTLRRVWTNSNLDKRLKPTGWTLTGIVLENANLKDAKFDDLDFTKANFNYGILYNASFRGAHFNGATLKDVYVSKVFLDGADFSGVTVYDGSRWEGSNWWNAKCVPQSLLDYLLTVDSHPLTQQEKSGIVSNCTSQ